MILKVGSYVPTNQVVNDVITPVLAVVLKCEKDCLFRRNQIFETPSLTAEEVNAAGRLSDSRRGKRFVFKRSKAGH